MSQGRIPMSEIRKLFAAEVAKHLTTSLAVVSQMAEGGRKGLRSHRRLGRRFPGGLCTADRH